MKLFLLQCLFALLWCVGCQRAPAPVLMDDAIEAAWMDYRLGEFDLAVQKFEQALERATPQSEMQLQALYGLASTWNLRRP